MIQSADTNAVLSMDIFEIKITLQHVDPPLWRRIQVPADVPLDELHDVIQIAMGWTDSHLHAFRTRDAQYGLPDPDFPSDTRDETDVPLDKVASEGDTLFYEYDFGDGWIHEISVEKVRPADPGAVYFRCTGGERACPPEDCGGPPGYERVLEVLGNPDDDEYEDVLEWIGEEFDPEALDVAEINEILDT